MENRTVIVGAGMAGLTAAAYLARENHDVLLLDKNDRIGGLVNTFENNRFFFDAGPRAFLNSGMVKPILKDLGIRWDFVGNRISIGIEDQLIYINSVDSLQEYERMLVHLFPESVEDVRKIVTVIRKLSEYTAVLYQFDNPNFVDLRSDMGFIFRKLLPWTVKLLFTLRKFNQFGMPMEEFAGKLTDNQSLTDMVLQHFFRETPTYFALGYFHVYMDYFYPKDGTGALPKLLKEKILDGGGEIRLNTYIDEVKPSASKVTDAEGNSYSYDHLIWAADLKTLYRMLNTEGLSAKLTAKIDTERERLLSSKGAESSFITFLAVNRPSSFFKENGGEHMFYTPFRKGLGETSREKRLDLIENFDKKSKSEILDWIDDFCRLNTYEVSVPVLRDSSLAPEGQTGVMISCLMDYPLIKKIDEAGWHEAFKEIMENHIIQIFSQTIYKGFEKDILYKFSSTPLTINKVAGSSEGAITGWSFETEIPVKNKLKDIPKSVLASIPDVFQAGQWAYAPSGVPTAMLTGWHASQEIIKESKKK